VLATSIHQLISRTQHDFGYTGIIVSHTIPQVFEITDYVVMLAGGVVEEVAPPEAFSVSESPIVQQFIHGRTEGPIEVL
jgi:phospholipid/cholesterol/gamma-HCH transport system ATP-binding protein